MPAPRRIIPPIAALAAASIALQVVGLGAPPASADAEAAPALVVTEIMQDNAGTPGDQDWFEYLEITNPTDQPVDLAEHRILYHNAGWLSLVDPGSDAHEPLTTAVVPAGGSVVVWLRYEVGNAESGTLAEQWELDEDDFRSHYGDAASAYTIYHAIGQSGFANSGTRQVRVFAANGTDLISSAAYSRAETNRGNADHFTLPASGTALIDPVAAAPTPGVVDPAQLTRPSGGGTTDPETVAANSGNAAAVSPFVITEINGDNAGADNYEFVEVVNTTDAPIDLTAAGIELRYHTSAWNAGTAQPFVHLDGEDDSPVVIPAGGVAVFWMNYDETDARRDLTKQQFRDFYGVAEDVTVYRFGTQRGFANAGDRGFSLVDADDRTITRAWVPADDGNSSTPWNAQFAVPDELTGVDARLVAHTHGQDAVAPAPGSITIDQVTSALERTTDPELTHAPILQITEVAPDTANVDGSDGYEFIEVYNASDQPVQWGDYVLDYLYTDNALTGPVTTSSTLWPSSPGDVVIPPAGVLVLWVKNPAVVAAGLTVDDFNQQFGTSLVLGETIVELFSGGMSNAGSRGLQVQTNTGHDVSRAYYFTNDQTTSTTAIQYAWHPADGEHAWTPDPADGTVQTMLGLGSPTPGTVSATQVRSGLVPAPAAGAAPVVIDRSATALGDGEETLDLRYTITDDVLVRTVRLTITDNLGATQERLLTVGDGDEYAYEVPAADLFGKDWIDVTVTAGDGSQTTTHGPVRVQLDDDDPDALRIDVADGDYRAGTATLIATSESSPESLEVRVDGSPLDTVASLERGPAFAFEATSTDAFFRNGVLLGDEVLTVFDEGFYDETETVATTVPVDEVRRGEPLTVTVVAGTKAWPRADVDENNDDFSAMNFRLALPDGRVLEPTSCATTKEADGAETEPAAYACPDDPSTRVGFSDAGLVSLHLTFTIPDDAFDSVAADWDTELTADGAHEVTATDGQSTATRTVYVDNTAPTVATTVEDGASYRGAFTVDATAVDSGAGLASLTATLDDEAVTLPLATSSLTMTPGAHELLLTASDVLGNAVARSVTFHTADEQPDAVPAYPADGAEAEVGDVELGAQVDSPEGDDLTVSFREGYRFDAADAELTASTGTVEAADAVERDGSPLSADEVEALLGLDGVDLRVASTTALPYQLFTVDVPAGAGADAVVRATWTGAANEQARVLLYARSAEGEWVLVDEHLTASEEDFELQGTVPVTGYAVDGSVSFLVQHSEGYAGAPASTRQDDVAPFHAEATARDEFDFTIAWESDTQYYNETAEYYQHQLAIHEFLLEEREELNLQYVMHTGDIVNVTEQAYQWENADAAYSMLDEAGLPYGVLAGNHDVSHAAADYTTYGSYFGEDRYADNPWYGGSYKNNRGHYDLVTAGGIDFLIMYMGWPDSDDEAANTEDIEWMNSVISQYPERKVWLNFHEYLMTTGGLGPYPQRVYDEVVATNPNVFAVGSGHYHDAYTRVDHFDDDGDGVAERAVTAMLFDYQGLAEGGQGFLRLLHFDNEGERIVVRTYSPSLDRFDSDDASLNDPPGMQEFEISYADAGITAREKVLAADAFTAEVLTSHEIGESVTVPSGTTVTVSWPGASVGEHGWYVIATGPHGGEDRSAVRELTVVQARSGGDSPVAPEEQDLNVGNRDGITLLSPSTFSPGATLQVRVDASYAGQTVYGWLFSDPIALGAAVVGADGIVAFRAPADTPVGDHRLVVTTQPGAVIGWTPVTVVAGELAATGAEGPWLSAMLAAMMLVLGAGAIVVRRRRRS